MKVFEHPLYQQDVELVAESPVPWEKLRYSNMVISGARGLLGSFLIDVLMYKNQHDALNCHIYALGRSEQKMAERFAYAYPSDYLTFIPYDVNEPLFNDDIAAVDYVLHLASNTHPVAYATDPIGTIATNIIGLKHMLDLAVAHQAKRFAFASSNEIYGENRGDVEQFDEDYCGYIDCNTLRAGYPESKRCGEALCQAYHSQKGLDVVIPRFTRSYGPTLQKSDTKAMSQFLRNALHHEDIILKSQGTQYYSYTYVVDAISGLLTVLLSGSSGEAYNIADEGSDIHLRDLAKTIAEFAGQKVIFDLPDAVEAAGYSKASKARLNSKKLQALGWHARFDIQEGIEHTMKICSELRE